MRSRLDCALKGSILALVNGSNGRTRTAGLGGKPPLRKPSRGYRQAKTADQP